MSRRIVLALAAGAIVVAALVLVADRSVRHRQAGAGVVDTRSDGVASVRAVVCRARRK